MGVPPAKLHENPAEANKSGTQGEQKAGFVDPVQTGQEACLTIFLQTFSPVRRI
jgi:hypothetical protein